MKEGESGSGFSFANQLDDNQFIDQLKNNNLISKKDYDNLNDIVKYNKRATEKISAVSSGSNTTRGIFAGGYGDSSPYPRYNIIEFITTATLGNCQDFGDLTSALSQNAGVCNATRGMIAGNGSPASKVIEVITIATLGNSARFGELSAMSHLLGGASSPIRGVYAGGYNPSSATNSMEYISLQTEGNAVDFGDLTVAGYGVYGLSNAHGGL